MSYPFLHVTNVRYLDGYRLVVSFTDGTEREVDLSDALEGEVFEPLRDEAMFASAYVDPETRTVSWSNGADFAPEFLRQISLEVAPADAR
ncbi:DUF2442 domain-containing protein [Rubrivirga sp.]|uniref:DUF2442 domain-containing protein n=1 Tax=Rubrivirga sp. TaxID=1885344 RepID=UPI003C7948C9